MRRFHKDTRLSENFTKKGLESLTGQPSWCWPRYICKELIDNALEEIEQPEITINVECYEAGYFTGIKKISIRDNGPGIPEDVIYQIFRDIEHFGGSKRHYKLPTRGNQGNALMTVLGIQYLISKPLLVTSNNTEYTINVAKNDLKDEYEIEIEKKPVEDIEGLEVRLNCEFEYEEGLDQIYDSFYKFVELNPQASFKLSIWFNDSGEPYRYETLAFEDTSVKNLSLNSKSTTTGKVIWFTENDFFERLKADYRVEPDLSVRDYIGEFYGLASSRKKSAVLDSRKLNGEIKTIGDLFNEKSIKEPLVKDLYRSMKQETHPFSARGIQKTLGSVDEEGMRHALINSLRLQFDNDQEQQLFESVKSIVKMARDIGKEIEFRDLFVYYADGSVVETDEKTTPFYFEMMAVPIDWEKKENHWQESSADLTFGINQSFLYSTPSLSMNVNTGIKERGYYGFEQAFSDLGYCFKVVCNLTCPNVDYQDKGKQQFNTKPFKPVFEEVLGKAIRKLKREVVPVLNKINEQPEPEQAELHGKAPQGFIKDFVFDSFIDVYNEATNNGQYTLTQRQFYYAMRPLFWELAESYGYRYSCKSTYENLKELRFEYDTFCGYVDEYEREILGERIIYKKDRGFFVEPHSERRINLGTSAVKNYHPDLDQYNSLLFVEKTGFYELLHNDFALSKRYDIGLINAEGYSTNATRSLVEKVQVARPEIRLYTLTDFDIDGLGIARDAKKADELSAVEIFDCVRLGVTLEDIERYSLPIEPVHYSQVDMKKLENAYIDGNITAEEYEFLKDNQRVEINVFKPIELRDYLISKFEEHGICKLRPGSPNDVETFEVETVESIKRRTIRETIGDYLISQLRAELEVHLENKLHLDNAGEEARGRLREIADDQNQTLYEVILQELKKLPPKNWKKINEELMKEKRSEADKIKREYQHILSQEVWKYLEEIDIPPLKLP